MAKNNQVQVCGDIITMLVAGVRNTDSDIEKDSIYLIIQPNSLDYNYFGSVSPPFLLQKQVHQSLFYKYGVDTIPDTDPVAPHYDNINTIRNNNINVRDVTACDGGISHNGVDTIPDTDRTATRYDNINTIRNNNINVRDVTTCDGGISHNGVDTIPDPDCVATHYNNINTIHNNNINVRDDTACEDDNRTSQCDRFDFGTVRYGNNDRLLFYRAWKQISLLIRVLIFGMIRLQYIPSIKAYTTLFVSTKIMMIEFLSQKQVHH